MNEDQIRISEVAAIEAAIRKTIIEPQHQTLTTPDGSEVEVLLVPNQEGGVSIVEPGPFVDKHRTAPIRRKGTSTLFDLDSFIAMTSRFSDGDSAVFASATQPPTFVSVLDYHRIGSEGGPRFGEHRATFTPVLSDEWKAWTSMHKRPMSQADFSDFIDQRIADLYDLGEKTPALVDDFIKATNAKLASKLAIVGVSQDFSMRTEMTIKGVKRLSTGDTTVSFEETNKAGDGGDLNVPSAFLIAIPVFRFGPRIALPVRLRFKKSGQAIAWHFDIFEATRAFEAEVADMIERVGLPPIPGDSSAGARSKAGTGLPVYRGTPEV